MSIHLKDFQESAINQLSLTFLDLWKTGNYKIPLIFKAPTGAGFHFKRWKIKFIIK